MARTLPFILQLQATPGINTITEYITPKWVVTNTVEQVYGDTSKVTEEKVQLYFDMTLREGNRGANNYRLSQPSDLSLLPKLSELNIPTLILWGEKDTWILPKYANLLKERIPNSSVIMYPDLGHVPMEEAPQRTVNDVIAFIGKKPMNTLSAAPPAAPPVALITGASQRLGAATAKQLHLQGYNVVIHYRHSSIEAMALTDQLNQVRDNSCIYLQADLNKQNDIQQLCQQSVQHWQRLDLLVNNASSFFPTPIGETSTEHWDDLFASNCKAPFFLSQELAPTLAKHQGNIVNMIDIHASAPLKNHSIYCMAKSALQMMTLSLAKELALTSVLTVLHPAPFFGLNLKPI